MMDSVVSVKTPEIKALLDAMHKDVGDLEEMECLLKTLKAATKRESLASETCLKSSKSQTLRKVRNSKEKQIKVARRLSTPKTLVNLKGMNVFVKKYDPVLGDLI